MCYLLRLALYPTKVGFGRHTRGLDFGGTNSALGHHRRHSLQGPANLVSSSLVVEFDPTERLQRSNISEPDTFFGITRDELFNFIGMQFEENDRNGPSPIY